MEDDGICMGVSKNRFFLPPKPSILIGVSIIFSIHFAGPPLFLETSVWIFGYWLFLCLDHLERKMMEDVALVHYI